MRSMSWRIEGLHPDAREVAREMARRSGGQIDEKEDHKLNRLTNQAEPNDLANDARYEAAGPPLRKDELAGQPQAVVPTEERIERYAALTLGSNARLIPTIAFDSTVAPRTTVYITSASPIETAVRPDYLAAALKGPPAVECPDQATERSTAPALMKERIGRQKSALSGKLNEGITSVVVGTSFIALALAISGLSWAFSFFGAPNLHLSRPPISAIEGAPLGSEPGSWGHVSSTPGDEAAAARKVISGPAQGSMAAVPPALRDEPLAMPMAISSGSKAIDPPRDEALEAPTASGSGRTDPPAPRDEALAAAPIATPSGPATVPQEQASGILNSTAHRAEPVAHDRHGTAVESGRAQRGTNLARVMHRSLHARPAHARRNSVLPKQCQATHDATRCLPLRHVRARGPAAHGPEGVRPRAPAWNSAPLRFTQTSTGG